MAEHTYTINATKMANIYPQSPDSGYSSTGSEIVYGEADTNGTFKSVREVLIGFDSSDLAEIKSKIVTTIRLNLYITQVYNQLKTGSTSDDAGIKFTVGKLTEWDKDAVTYNAYNSGTAATTDSSTWLVSGSAGKYLTTPIGRDIDLATGCTKVKIFETAAQKLTQIKFEAIGGDNPPFLTVMAKDGKPVTTPLAPIGTYEDSLTAIKFEWSYEDDTGGEQASYELQYRDIAHEEWTTAASGESTEHNCTVAANTFAGGEVKWRVRVTNNNEIPTTSEWSETALFIAQGAPQAPSLSVATSPRPKMEWISLDQRAYQIMVDGITVARAYGTQKTYTVKRYLEDGNHTLGVRIQNEFGLWSEWATQTITVTNTPGAAITLFATGGEKATLAWTETNHEAYYVYRDDIPIAKTAGHTYTDQMAIGTHKYKVRGVAGDSYSMSNEVTVTLSVDAPEIAALGEMQWLRLEYSTAQNSPLGVSTYQDVAYQFYAGRRYPVAETSQQITKIYSFNAAFNDAAQAAAFEGLLGKTVVYRDQHNRLFTGPLMAYELSVDQFFSAYSCSIQQTDNMERIEYD